MSGASGQAPTDTLGPLIIGYTVNAILYGVTNVQSFTYCHRFWCRDPPPLKYFVVFLWLLDTLQMALTSHCVYFYVIIHFGEADAIFSKQVVWSLEAFLVVTAFGDYLVRCFYCERLWRLSTSNVSLAIGVNIVSLFSFACGILFVVTHRNFGAASEKMEWVTYLNTTAILVSDTSIAVALVICLRRADRVGHARTHSIVARLMRYVVGTSMLTSLCALASLITLAAMPHTFIFIGFLMTLSKLYFNAMLANLNARTFLREMKASSRPSQTFSSHTRTEDILGSRSFDSAGTQVIASSSSAKDDILELDDGVKYLRHGS